MTNMKSLINPDDDYLNLDIALGDDEPKIAPHPLIRASHLLDMLKPKQEDFLVAKLYGMSDAGAMRAIDMAPQTAYHWKQDPGFKEAYDLVTENPVVMAAEVVAFGLAKAMNQLVNMLDHPSIAVQQFAIEKLVAISGIQKQRMEVTHKNDPSDGDIDRLLDKLDERTDKRAGDGTGDSEV